MGAAGKLVASPLHGTRNLVVIFAAFAGEAPSDSIAPEWAAGIFDPEAPGSFSHFYDAMSFGRLRVRGEVAGRRYASDRNADAYLATDATSLGRAGEFAWEILQKADADVDFSRFDNDGPDGQPNSGDDDGVVDGVILMLRSVPARFLIGPATGRANLGLMADFVTDDAGPAGPIRVGARSGTIQQARRYSEAVGVACHEFSHLLGLPDLMYLGHLHNPGVSPEEEGAGIGAWGLMGWGATGWHGDDGPNSLSAWSRAQLGWTEVVQIRRPREEVRLEPVGTGGAVYKVPVDGEEYFLFEYRTRSGSYYDRHIPGEGVLVWHVAPTAPEPGRPFGVAVDLECADGLWANAGYPIGTRPDIRGGGDNLDFWARDPEYTRVHGGNLGDATDPFDGVTYTAFTPDTNPAAMSESGTRSIRVEGIRVEDGVARFTVETAPRELAVRGVRVADEDSNGLVFAGEEVTVAPTVVNTGGLEIESLSARLRCDDPHLEILAHQAEYGTLRIGAEGSTPLAGGRLAFRFGKQFAGVHRGQLVLELIADGQLAGTHDIALQGYAVRQEIESITIVDSLGNGDGLAQAGEFLRLSLRFAPPTAMPDSVGLQQLKQALRFLQFELVPLSDRAVPTGGSSMIVDSDGGAVWSRSTPEYLLSADVTPGSWLLFQLRVESPQGTWVDTLAIQVEEGPDRTPPRVLPLWTSPIEDGVSLRLPEVHVLDGGAIADARVHVYRVEDTVQVATISLVRQDGRYEGTWTPGEQGVYLAQAEVVDAAGNVGWSRMQGLSVLAQRDVPPGVPSDWRLLELPGQVQVDLHSVAIAPSNPQVLYGAGPQALWVSLDGGESWTRTGYMVGLRKGSARAPLIDAADPFTIYLDPDGLVSHDGGLSWAQLVEPGDGLSLVAADPVRPGKLYGYRSEGNGHLVISGDGGISWRGTPVVGWARVMVNPTDPSEIYAGSAGRWDRERQILEPGRIWHSRDWGVTWEEHELPRGFQTWVMDPHTPDRLLAAYADTVFESTDRGQSWEMATILGQPMARLWIEVHPSVAGSMTAMDLSYGAWSSWDGGSTWEEMGIPGGGSYTYVMSLVMDPYDAEKLYAGLWQDFGWGLYMSSDGGGHWKPLAKPVGVPQAGTLEFAPSGEMVVGSGLQAEDGTALPVVYTRAGDQTWERHGWEAETTYPGMGSRLAIDALYIDPVDPDVLIGAYMCRIVRSGDGGSTWGELGPPGTCSARLMLRPDALRPGVLYLATDWIWRSEDRGESWEEIAEVSATGLLLEDGAPPIMYAAVDSAVWRSTDEGATWDEDHGHVDGEVVLLARDPGSPGLFYALTYDGFHRSDDRGQTWSRLARFEPALGFESRLRFHPTEPTTMYLVTGGRLLRTTDGGVSWLEIDAGMSPRVYFHDVGVDPTDPEALYAATPWGVYQLSPGSRTAVDQGNAGLPAAYGLEQNYPNPFNPSTVIRFSIPSAAKTSVCVYNVLGQKVRTLLDAHREPGAYSVRWDGSDDAGRAMSSGVYLCRLQAGSEATTSRMVLLK